MDVETHARTNPILIRIPLAVAGGILFGAFFASLFSPLSISLVASLCALSLLLFGFFLRRHAVLFMGALFFFSILLVSGRMLMLQESFRSPALEAVVGTKTLLTGVITEDPDVRDTSTILTVKLSSVNGARARAKVRVSTDHFTEFLYGDEIRIVGVPTIPQPFTTDAGSTFDYPHYLLAHGITHEIKNASLSVVAHGKGNFLVAYLLSFKHLLSNQIGVILP
ncbi:MAG: DUF4131 domain-containing protein, partial [Patescibacteria group bacterium]